MPTKDDYRTVARKIKRELDLERLAFKTYHYEQFATELKAVSGPGAHSNVDSSQEVSHFRSQN